MARLYRHGEVQVRSALVPGERSRGVGGAPLQQEGVAVVADPDRFGRGGQRQLVV